MRSIVNERSPLALAMILATSESIPSEAALVIRCLRKLSNPWSLGSSEPDEVCCVYGDDSSDLKNPTPARSLDRANVRLC